MNRELDPVEKPRGNSRWLLILRMECERLRDAGQPSRMHANVHNGRLHKTYQSVTRTKCFQPEYGRYMLSLCSFNSLYGDLPPRNMRMIRRDTIMARDAWSHAGKNRHHEHMNRVK